MLKSVRVPEAFLPPFVQAEKYVEELFGSLERRPDQGALRIGGQRYVLMRCESLYLSWFDALAETFGEEMARDFVYNTAREIGRSDSADFVRRLAVDDGVERLSCGPVHFAHAGWASVDILEDSRPAKDSSYYLHYTHPNTFESEVLKARGKQVEHCACLFSAGYSAGWCSEAFEVEVHAREVRCVAKGDACCEFVMAPTASLQAKIEFALAEAK
jgi:predicted hydrocarbon binding protein